MKRFALIAALCLCGLLANAAGEGVIVETPEEYDRMFGKGAYAEHLREIEERSRWTREHMDAWRKHAEWELKQKYGDSAVQGTHTDEQAAWRRQQTKPDVAPDSLSIQRAHFDGHDYVLFYAKGAGMAVVHSPNCPCRKEVAK